MKLIFLYGPAAVGKLTTAEALVRLTGFKLLHLHQIFNMLSDIFGIESDTRWQLGREIRLRIFEEAAKENVSMITTFGGGSEEFDFFEDVTDAVEKNGGTVCFVKLSAETDEIYKRVQNTSRGTHRKITTVEKLKHHFQRFPGVFDTYPKREHLLIDNTHTSAEDVAKNIIDYYQLSV